MKKVENAIETILSGARWLLVPLYLGLTISGAGRDEIHCGTLACGYWIHKANAYEY